MADLNELRGEINSLDEQIVRLLNQRAAAAVEIGKLKQTHGSAVFAPDREHEILKRITDCSAGPLSKASLLAIYRELMSASFALERPPRVGYLGPNGSFSHEAAIAKFGTSVEYEPLADVRGVFDEMTRGHLDYGIVPIENKTGGSVLDALDAFIDHDVTICNEVHLAIHHNLLANCRLEEIETVYSKPEVFTQCRRWLAETGFGERIQTAPSSSRAAEIAAASHRGAAIGGALAAKLYELQVMFANIEDDPQNTTRFVVLGGDSARPTGSDRTSVMFATAHRAGALVEVLLVFQRAGVNMTMITSRPSGKADAEYHFFVDMDGHADEEPMKKALAEARELCRPLRVLGSYPKATEVIAA